MVNHNQNLGNLFLIPSSIEQIEDVPFLLDQQKKLLKNIKYFIVENEKIARKTLLKIELKTKIQSVTLNKYNNKTSDFEMKKFLEPLFNGNDIGLLSDSGSPCIADPGANIVKYAHLNNIRVRPLIGPSSIILSLMASGFNGQKFKFHGYIPIKNSEKEIYIKKMMESVKKDKETQIFIETPFRNEQLLKDLLRILEDKIELCIAINLTGSHQKIYRDSIANWRLKKLINVKKKLCIFLIN